MVCKNYEVMITNAKRIVVMPQYHIVEDGFIMLAGTIYPRSSSPFYIVTYYI